MRDRIIYLLGAGASANCLPIVEKLNSSICDFKSILGKAKDEFERVIEGKLGNDLTNKARASFLYVEKELDWLLKSSSENRTLDDFAAELYSNNKHQDYERLKNILSFYFEVHQYINKPDNRYRQFINSIRVDNNGKFPDDITLFSWNYDIQFEINYGAITNEKNIQAIISQLSVVNRGSYFSPTSDKFSIVKLNGTAGFFRGERRVFDTISTAFTNELKIDDWITLVNSYYDLVLDRRRNFSSLLFRFEDTSDSDDWFNSVQKIVKQATALVVIGYSFQPLNAQTDIKILNALTNCRNVHVVDPNASRVEEEIKKLSPELKDVQFIKHSSTSSFPPPSSVRL